MARWDLKCGSITEYYPNEDRIWSLCHDIFVENSIGSRTLGKICVV